MKAFKRNLLIAVFLGISIMLPISAMFDNGNNNPFTYERQSRSNCNLTGMQGTESNITNDIERLSRESVLAELNDVRVLIQQVVNVLSHNNGITSVMSGEDDALSDISGNDDMEALEIVPLFESNNNLSIAKVASQSTIISFLNRASHDKNAQELINDFNSPIFKDFLARHNFSDTLENRVGALPLYIINLQGRFGALSASSSTSSPASMASRFEAVPGDSFDDFQGVIDTDFADMESNELSMLEKQNIELERQNAELEKQLSNDVIDAEVLSDLPYGSSVAVEQSTSVSFLEKTTQFATSSQKAFSDFLGKAREKASQCFNSGVAKVRSVRERFKRKRLGDDIESQSSFISDLDSQGQKRKKETDLPMVQPIGNDMVQITGLNGSESYQTDLRSINIHFDQATESFDIYTWNKNYTLNIRATFPLNLAVEHVASDVLKNSNPYSFDPERGIDLRVEQNSVIFLDHQTQNVLARFSRQNLNQSQYDIINIIYTTAMNNLSNVALVASPLIYSALSYVHPVAPLVVVAYDIYKIIDNAGRYIVKVVKNNTH